VNVTTTPPPSADVKKDWGYTCTSPYIWSGA